MSLQQAVRQALAHHPSTEAATARVRAAESRIAQARSGRMPHDSYSESLQSGNNPVFVFGALLNQHRFTAANFDIPTLNRPSPLNNFQTPLSVVLGMTVSPYLYWFTASVGLNLFQSAFTNWRPIMSILRGLGVKG